MHMLLFNDLPWVANPTLYRFKSGIYGNQGKSRWENKTMAQVCSCSWESEKAQWHTYALQVRVTLLFIK